MAAHNSFPEAVDHGIRLAGGHNALARRLRVSTANLAHAKAGRAVLTHAQIERLAALVDDDAAHLWTLCQLNRLPTRNPFLKRR